LDPIGLALCDERLQRSHVHLSQIQLADERVELLQVKRILLDALLVQVLVEIFRSRRPERAPCWNAVLGRCADFAYPLRELLLGFLDVASSSALANADS